MEQKSAACVTGYTETPTAKIAADELKNYWQGKPIHLILDKSMADDEVEQRLIHQQENAREWRDHCLNYFKSIKDATD